MYIIIRYGKEAITAVDCPFEESSLIPIDSNYAINNLSKASPTNTPPDNFQLLVGKAWVECVEKGYNHILVLKCDDLKYVANSSPFHVDSSVDIQMVNPSLLYSIVRYKHDFNTDENTSDEIEKIKERGLDVVDFAIDYRGSETLNRCPVIFNTDLIKSLIKS